MRSRASVRVVSRPARRKLGEGEPKPPRIVTPAVAHTSHRREATAVGCAVVVARCRCADTPFARVSDRRCDQQVRAFWLVGAQVVEGQP